MEKERKECECKVCKCKDFYTVNVYLYICSKCFTSYKKEDISGNNKL